MRRVDPGLYTKKYYLTDATGYDEYKRSYGKLLEPRLKRIVDEIPDVNSARVLDVGCGRGELAYWAARRGAKNVLGIDYSKAAIELAKNAKKHWPKEIKSKVSFKVMDAKNMLFKDKSFDAIFLTEIFEHIYPEEQEQIMNILIEILSEKGFIFIHTAPTKWFNNYTYRFWCYPMSTMLVKIYNIFSRGKYPNILKPEKLRTDSHKLMHINEPNYFSLKRLFNKYELRGDIYSTNITINKPRISWKDDLFNILIYLSPLSNYPPLNILWGNDYYSVLRKQ